MHDPCLIALPPYRENIRYHVKPKIRLEDLASLLSSSLIEGRANSPKTVVFVRQYTDCSNLYLMIRAKMGVTFTEPPGYPDHAKFRLAEMYSRVARNEKKEQILPTFLCPKTGYNYNFFQHGSRLSRYQCNNALGSSIYFRGVCARNW